MMNKKSKGNKVIIILVASFVFIIGMFIAISANANSGLIYIGNDEVEAILEDMSGRGTLVYVGSPSCPACNAFRPTVDVVLDRLGVGLYYFETDAAMAENTIRTRENLERTATSTPTIVYIVNGEVVDLTHSVSSAQLEEFFERNSEGLR